MRQTQPLQLLHLLWLFCMLVACHPPEPTVMRIGTNLWPGYEPLYFARDLSLLQEPEVQLVEYRSTSQVINAFQKGVIDFAAVTLDEAVRMAAAGDDIEVIWIFDISNGADQLLARRGFDSIESLKGRRIAVEESALGAFILQRMIDIYQVDDTDFQIVPLPVSEHAHSMAQGHIDAAITFEPAKSEMMKLGAVSLFTSKQLPGEIIDVLIARRGPQRNFTDQQIIKLLGDYNRALQDIMDDLPSHLPALNRRLKIPEHDLAIAFQELTIPSRAEQLTLFRNRERLNQLLAQYQQALQSRGLISNPCECANLLNSRYLEALP